MVENLRVILIREKNNGISDYVAVLNNIIGFLLEEICMSALHFVSELKVPKVNDKNFKKSQKQYFLRPPLLREKMWTLNHRGFFRVFFTIITVGASSSKIYLIFNTAYRPVIARATPIWTHCNLISAQLLLYTLLYFAEAL